MAVLERTLVKEYSWIVIHANHIECFSLTLFLGMIFSIEILGTFALITFEHHGLPSQDQVEYKENWLSSFFRAHSYGRAYTSAGFKVCLCYLIAK